MNQSLNKNFFYDANRKNLLQLISLRIIATLGQIIVILVAAGFLEIELPLAMMAAVLIFVTIVNSVSFYRYKTSKKISDKSLFIELVFDVTALAAQLYLSGGVSNPFISLFLLQVIIAAVLLSQLYAWMIAIVTSGCYVFLSFRYLEIDAFHHGEGFNMHLHGMLISYVLAAMLLVIFIGGISKNLRERDKKTFEEQQLLRSALLAVSAAHELSTPLTTISVVLDDWKKSDLKKDDLLDDIKLVEAQIERCKKTISEILSDSGRARLERAKREDYE